MVFPWSLRHVIPKYRRTTSNNITLPNCQQSNKQNKQNGGGRHHNRSNTNGGGSNKKSPLHNFCANFSLYVYTCNKFKYCWTHGYGTGHIGNQCQNCYVGHTPNTRNPGSDNNSTHSYRTKSPSAVGPVERNTLTAWSGTNR